VVASAATAFFSAGVMEYWEFHNCPITPSHLPLAPPNAAGELEMLDVGDLTMKIRRLWFIALAGVVGAITLLFHYKERNSYQCQTCGARKDVFQWRLGMWKEASVPLSPSWEQISGTRFQQDFLPPGHHHDWVFAQGSPYYFFGTTWAGCALGRGRSTCELGRMYESSPEFRDFLSQKLRDGSLSKAKVIEMVSHPPSSQPSPLQKEADELLKTFYAQ
jgi:hypothetical protein